MNNNKTTKRNIEDTWLCNNCGANIIPFEPGKSGGFAEGVLVFTGIAALIFINFFVGGVFIALAVIIGLLRASGNKKICPSCESVNIVPSNSPAAQNRTPNRAARIRAR